MAKAKPKALNQNAEGQRQRRGRESEPPTTAQLQRIEGLWARAPKGFLIPSPPRTRAQAERLIRLMSRWAQAKRIEQGPYEGRAREVVKVWGGRG